MIASIIDGVLKLGTEGLKLANTKALRKYVDILYELESDLLDEKSHGQTSDDRKIEHLESQIEVALNAIKREIQLAAGKDD